MATDIKKAARYASCPSCGAQTPIYSRATVQVVCAFCRSTLIRKDLQWDEVGKMAALADDLTPFFVGMRGKYHETDFMIIGRLQMQFDEGIWNEWLLQWSNHRVSWLGEGSGLLYLTHLSEAQDGLPESAALNVGQQIILAGKSYAVSNIQRAACIATAGEIPFVATPNQLATYVDLAGSDGLFASLDYSDKFPKLYTGTTASLSEFELEARDDGRLKKQLVGELRCAGCGNAITLRNHDSLSVVCSSCNVVNNVSPSGKLVVSYRQAIAKFNPLLPLGATGTLAGSSYEIVGFSRVSGGGERWDEYLLYNSSEGVGWLICSAGHWTFMRPANPPSVIGRDAYYKGKNYKHYAEYQVSVDAVLGEFYWQLKRGESRACDDYISPPFIISREKTAKEITWSHGIYLNQAEIASAFNVRVPSKQGVGANEPSPPTLKYVAAFFMSMTLVLLIDMIAPSKNVQTLQFNHLELTDQTHSAHSVSEPFSLTAAHSIFKVHSETNLSNDWVELEYRLTNQATGKTRVMTREVSYYSGTDSDGSWSEGAYSDDALLANVEAGTYVLEVNAESQTHNNLSISVSAAHGEACIKNFWLVFIVLLAGPLLAILYQYYFEKRRWDASDHPWEHWQ